MLNESAASHIARIEPELPLWTIRLDKKTLLLEKAGIRTVRDLGEALRTGLLFRIPGVGLKTIREAAAKLERLAASISREDGSINWQAYHELCGLPAVPSCDVESGAAFLAVFGEVIEAIIRFQDNPIDRIILTERLMRQPHERMTLDAVAAAAPVRVTRERVRQRQEVLLHGISAALLHNDCRELQFCFRESFARRWREAAELFGGEREISFSRFMAGLVQAWGVSAAELYPHLPLVTSILTSRAQLPASMREGLQLSPKLLCPIDAALVRAPVAWLSAAKLTEEIRERGCETVGEFVDAAKAGRLPASQSVIGRKCVEILDAIAEGLDGDGKFSWPAYASARGVAQLPVDERATPGEFLACLNDDLEEIVRANATSIRAADVFRLRTCMPRASRRTLDEVARLLGTHGPSVKREESLLLDALHSQLVLGDYSFSRVLFRPRFREFWREAWRVHRECGMDFEDFSAALAAEWSLPFREVRRGSDAIWAVLTRYPNGRLTAGRQRRPAAAAPFEGGTIVLRGFRRLY